MLLLDRIPFRRRFVMEKERQNSLPRQTQAWGLALLLLGCKHLPDKTFGQILGDAARGKLLGVTR